MEEIIHFDKQLLLMVNGSDSLFLDSLIMTLTTAQTWIPLYVGLLYVVWYANKPNVRDILLVIAAAGLCVLLAGAVDDEIVKPLVARWRPTHDPEIGHLVDTVNGYRGGNYGFFSAHAANTFSIAIFFSLLMRQRLFTVFMVCWSLTNCYTRLYLGVHYPGDITVGLLWGGFVGWFVWRIHSWTRQRWGTSTPTVYPMELCRIPMLILVFILLYAIVKAMIATL